MFLTFALIHDHYRKMKATYIGSEQAKSSANQAFFLFSNPRLYFLSKTMYFL